MTVIDNSPHALYRFYDATGVLLYVGITADPGVRFKKHRGDKEWWTEVANIRIEKLPTRAAVLDAERRAIREERPLWNVAHNDAAQAVRTPRGDFRDQRGRLLSSADPAWCRLATSHPQLLAVEQYLRHIGDQYLDIYGYLQDSKFADTEYICGHALWYGVGNALDLLGGVRLSSKAITEAVAGLCAGVPLIDDPDEVSLWPESVFTGPLGFIHVLIGKGWDAPAELCSPEAGHVVYQRMLALMPNCDGPCICKPQPWR
ncbi:GIY-YIG nuclease family protein [Streptosporangium sp. NPDC023963]|uniref:GIY-YIG nuclease family protein n=1 Tax=Streptosporangium sp. NPDC023963 TaxID=3155608 RepID=UPI00341CC08C